MVTSMDKLKQMHSLGVLAATEYLQVNGEVRRLSPRLVRTLRHQLMHEGKYLTGNARIVTQAIIDDLNEEVANYEGD